MTMDNERCRRATERAAAKWYVEMDAQRGDLEREAALVEWLACSPDHEAAFERCEASVMLASALAACGALEDAADARGALADAADARGALADAAAARGTVADAVDARGAVDEAVDGRGALVEAVDACGAVDSGLAGRPEHWRDGARTRRWLRERVLRILGSRALPLEWLGRPAVAWSVAAVAVVWAVAATVESGAPSVVADGSGRTPGVAAAGAGDLVTAPSAGDSPGLGAAGGTRANERVPIADATIPNAETVSIEKWNPVGVLPGDIVVDAHSVAVLPFDGALQMMRSDVGAGNAAASDAAERIARQLHDEVVRQLSLIPGVFVVDGRSSELYAGSELGPDEIAALLGVRGVVAADVSLDGRIVTVSLRMTDAVNEGRRTETTFATPVDELPAVRTAIVSNITEALASTAF